MRRIALPASFCVLLLAAVAAGAAVDLLTALDSGLIAAQFRGAGGDRVMGTIERLTPQPLEVVIQPGTQFYAQFGGFGGGFGPGRGGIGQRGIQGMSTFGLTPVDLRSKSVAFVRVPTCCTDFGLREPGPDDVLVPGPPREPQIAKVAAVAARERTEHNVAQLAIWAVANNIPKWAARKYVRSLGYSNASKQEVRQRTEELTKMASGLVERAGLDVNRYRLFK